ncbi:DUF3144 domain-containing protein [Haliea atlantica]|jgi:hypothetical protein|tara:strand:- start:837 stop:1112 length:276 start_codon:yes stop_codon:yes gene_type:complete
MTATDQEQHHQCMQRFIDLANTMKNEGVPTRVISAGLMTASGVYATYTVAGNSGGLNPSGVDKVAEAYKENLQRIQEAKREEAQAAQQQGN